MNVPTIVTLLAVLIPVKTWFAPSQPVMVKVKATAPLTLVATDFSGKAIASRDTSEITGEKMVDLKGIFPALSDPGTYVVFAVPKGADIAKFVGTPLVVSVRADNRRNAPPGPEVI